MLKCKISTEYEIPIIELEGRFDGYGSSIFDDKITAVQKDAKNWIIDFIEVDYLSSAGIRSLLKCEKKLRKSKGRLHLVNLSPEVEKILEITGLLSQFCTYNKIENAKAKIQTDLQTLSSNKKIILDNLEYTFTNFKNNRSAIDIWGDFPNQKNGYEHALITTNLLEVGFAFGLGSLGSPRDFDKTSYGEFLSTENFFGVKPLDQNYNSDFFITNNPADTNISLKHALEFNGRPNGIISMKSSEPVKIKKIISHIFQIIPSKTEIPIGMIISTTGSGKTDSGKHVLAIGAAFREEALDRFEIFKKLLESQNNLNFQKTDDFFYHFNSVFLAGIDQTIREDISSLTNPKEVFSSLIKLENLEDVTALHSDLETKSIRIWLFIPAKIRSAEEKRLQIETDGKTEIKPEWDTIIRKIFRKSSQIKLEELPGGFTAKTFVVSSFDRQGRRQLPSVLKIGSAQETEDEVNGYKNYVKDYILNNSTTILGTNYQGDWGGLQYNFLGINGPQSELHWLTDYYRSELVDKLKSIFDTVFTDILKPWYGQPKLEKVFLFREHDPINIFPNLLAQVEKIANISPDEKLIFFEPLNEKLLNPYYFLKHVFPKWKDYSKLWYKSIIHGDLNMQNILLDEKKNIYIIDFPQTGFRNIVSDFARLEPIFKFEMTDLRTD